jgi:hypothetical protein
MLKLATLCVTGILCIGSVPDANAYTFTPRSTKFTASGNFEYGPNSCNLKLRGHTTGRGRAEITSVVVQAGGQNCTATFIGLPWPTTATGPTGSNASVTITNFGFNTSLFSCGSQSIYGTADQNGLWTDFNPVIPDCSFLLDFLTVPAITTIQ